MRSRTRRRPLRIVVEGGEPSAVILSIAEYRELRERAEDVEDLRVLGDMRKKPLKFKTLEDFLVQGSSRV